MKNKKKKKKKQNNNDDCPMNPESKLFGQRELPKQPIEIQTTAEKQKKDQIRDIIIGVLKEKNIREVQLGDRSEKTKIISEIFE